MVAAAEASTVSQKALKAVPKPHWVTEDGHTAFANGHPVEPGDRLALAMSKVIKALVPKAMRPVIHQSFKETWFAGNQVTCPCCNSTWRRFMPFGQQKRRGNAQCPACQTLERHRGLWLYLTEKTDLFGRSGRMLHVAPETFFQRQFSQLPNVGYLTVDIDPGKAMLQADVRDLSFEEATFDVIMANHVLEHVDDDRQAMRELYRVLKPGGWAILQCPVDINRADTLEDPSITGEADRLKYYGQEDHVRQYGRDYADRLRDAGFDVTVDEFLYDLPEADRERYALVPEVIYMCRKA